MKDSLLLLMTPNVSLEVWNKNGQLLRELNFYNKLCKATDLKLIIYSYGQNEQSYINGWDNVIVLEMPKWIPRTLPFRLQNIIYHYSSLIAYRKYFNRVKIAKTNQFRASAFGVMLKLIFGIPLVIRMGFYHSHLKSLSKPQKIKESLRFNFCDKIIVTSPEAEKFINNSYNINRRKILTMCNAIDLDLFKPTNIEKQYDLIYVGRLEKVKNIELLVEVISTNELKTLIIGDGSLSNMIKEAVEKYPNITWKQKVNNTDLPLLYNSSNIFILLSQHEGNPKSLLEAMACGLPCIGNNVPGIRECINTGYTGVLVNANAGAIQQQIFELLNNKTTSKVIGDNAVKWVREECDMMKNIDREHNFYKSIINTAVAV